MDYLTNTGCLPAFRKNVEALMRKNSQQRGAAHFLQVTRLALRLYDELEHAHRLTPRYRGVLWAAAMLHDIGVATACTDRDHPWRSGQMILHAQKQLSCGDGLLTVTEVATVAALHGIDEATPDDPLGRLCEPLLSLWPDAAVPRELQVLAGILRVADGLDRNLRQSVQDVELSGATLLVLATNDVSENIRRAQQKASLLSKCLACEWKIRQQHRFQFILSIL